MKVIKVIKFLVLVGLFLWSCEKAPIPTAPESGEEEKEKVKLIIESQSTGRKEISGAGVYLDGNKVGETPYEDSIKQGSYNLLVYKKNYEASSERIFVETHMDSVYHCSVLEKREDSTGTVYFDLAQKAKIKIKDEDSEKLIKKDSTSSLKLNLEEGIYVWEASAFGYLSQESKFVVNTGLKIINISLEEKPSLVPLELSFSISEDSVALTKEATFNWSSSGEKVQIDYLGERTPDGQEGYKFSSTGKKVVSCVAFSDDKSSIIKDSVIVFEKEDSTKIDVEAIIIPEKSGIAINAAAPLIDKEAASVFIETQGYYRIKVSATYSGVSEKNESYFLQLKGPQGTLRGPQNTNAGDLYKIIEDDGYAGKKKRDSGIFYFPKGENKIQLHHYYEVAEDYPIFKNGNFTGAEDVLVEGLRLIYVGKK